MTRWLFRSFTAVSVALVFFVTLTLYWPLPMLAYWLKDDLGTQVGWRNVEGRLLDGRVGQLSFTPQGAFPLVMGPVTWHIAWPGHLNLMLGEPAQAWTLTALLNGAAVDWQLEGGSLSALGTSQLPLSPAGDWLGKLAVTTRGQRCVSAKGALTSGDLRLLTPDPIPLGQARLALGCSDGAYRWELAVSDPPGLELTSTLDMATNGDARGELKGHLAQDHSLSAWRRLLQPDATGDTLHHEFGW